MWGFLDGGTKIREKYNLLLVIGRFNHVRHGGLTSLTGAIEPTE